jgi:HrpA-like RNA helicase
MISDEFLDNLPIHPRKAEILAAVDENQVTIITAETGAGKSTQVPQYLAEHGYDKVIVTQPRILAARNLCTRVREEMSFRRGNEATGLVGYRTAPERDDAPENVILYCTDGLQLVRELTGHGTRGRQILVLDEVHEWNENMEVLVAWAKKRCGEDPGFKMVLMSATIDAGSLAAYFGAPPAIAVEGRSFGVTKRRGGDLVDEVMKVAEGAPRNLLVFLPGKAEIEQVGEALRTALKRPVPVLALHGQMEPADQQRAFASYDEGKIVLTTNVAQTSITIDDIDVVVDSGLERRAEVRHGVEGLFIAEVSQADLEQRAGRAGRTRPGEYILAQLGNLPCPPFEARPQYGVPEIMRTLLDRMVLRLASIGIDVETLEFYHAPSRAALKLAKRTLVTLGAMTKWGEVTDVGHRMERFPVSSGYARMLVEAEEYPAAVQSKLATVIALQEVGGIIKGGSRYTGWRQYTKQKLSDLLAAYEVYLALPRLDAVELEEIGIITKNVDKAGDVVERLHRELGLDHPVLEAVASGEEPLLRRCIVAGQMDQIWTLDPGGTATHVRSGQQRELSVSSVVKRASLVTGTPFDLEVTTRKGLETLELVNDVTVADPVWLEELAPDDFSIRAGKLRYDPRIGMMAVATMVKFGKRTFEAASAPVQEHSAENEKLFVDLYSKYVQERLDQERKVFEMMQGQTPPEVGRRQIRERVQTVAAGAVSPGELPREPQVELDSLCRLETWLGAAYHIDARMTPGEALRRQGGRHGRPRGLPGRGSGPGRGRRRGR